MPTERERDYHNPEPDVHGFIEPEIKIDNKPSIRLKFLDQAEQYMYNFSIVPFTIRSIVLLLASYGLYKIIF